jgi:hypothetical protein
MRGGKAEQCSASERVTGFGALATQLRHHHLNLDPALTDRVGPSGQTPKEALAEQLEALR